MLKKLATSALLMLSTLTVNASIIVDLELQLLADVSGSVDSSEYALQLQGYADAFKSTSVHNAITSGANGGIAVQYIEWSTNQAIQLNWTLINSAASANAFADLLAGLSRANNIGSSTGIGSAIDFGKDLFATNDFTSARQVMDVSGDGTNNVGLTPAGARDDALSAGVDTINGIVITTNQNVVDQYLDEVVNGETPFLLAPGNFDDFQTSIENKIVAEISGTSPTGAVTVPEPGTLGLFAIPVAFMCFRKRTIKEKKS